MLNAKIRKLYGIFILLNPTCEICFMKKSQLYVLAIISGLMLSLSWPARGFPFLVFIAFIPLLWIEHETSNNKFYFKKLSFFGYAYLTMVIWNASSCWWIIHASLFGAVAVIVLNSLVMAVVLHLFHITKKILPRKSQGYIALLFFWITFEYLHQDWELAWPWLNLGYVFASHPAWIQWYEFTGFLGGSLWVLSINIVLFQILKNIVFVQVKRKTNTIAIASVLVIFLAPAIFSLATYYRYEENGETKNVVVVQPNIDPFTEKYDKLSPNEQLDIMLDLANKEINASTDLVVFPETALVGGIWENNLERNRLIKKIQTFLMSYPELNVLIGAMTFKLYGKERQTNSSRKQEATGNYYDAFNTALFIENDSRIQKYHKTQLVPGVERVPFPFFVDVFGDFAVDLGGTTGTLGTQKQRTIFTSKINGMKIAPIICYESVFGEYITEFISNGANLIAIITNDGWWKDSPGYRQHMHYARVRAIETRRNIVRSANTGISGFIDSKGKITKQTNWWEPDVIEAKVKLSDEITFYVKSGDFIGRLFSFFCALLLLYAVTTNVLNRSKMNKLNKI